VKVRAGVSLTRCFFIMLLGVIVLFQLSCSSRSKKDEKAAARARAIARQIPLRAEHAETAEAAPEKSEKSETTVMSDTQSQPTDTLYSRMGGQQTIDKFVADFVPKLAVDARLAKNPNVAAAFKKADLEKFKTSLASQLCGLTGGPCTYAGRPMKAAHAGMKISEEDWKAMGQVFMNSLKKVNVGAKERQELARLVTKFKKDIIGQ
jgi:hemoglobin